ncbi:hypothetical protein MLD38_031710 [Melastoma candidum]|uniref:Uncharacterized protein n=1 Tax=Melastoma candidum TaxID=119954 RepID=A0ACB9MSC1_9MYRT|nr:hypothetical protein MLD38_031710 [Melastoma candidum]
MMASPMSSRNVNLTSEEWQKRHCLAVLQALSISRSLSMAKQGAEKGEHSFQILKDSVICAIEEAGGRIDYAEIVKQDTLEAATEIRSPVVFCVATCFGKVRIID